MKSDALMEGVTETLLPSLAEKVRFLASPSHYPGLPAHVQVIQTHMSYVFLTTHDVYKFKKPVHNDFFDFRGLSARRENCENEVRLNHRLAPITYLGVVALNQGASGLRLGGKGKTVEWLVHMRRLPPEQTLDYLLRNGLIHLNQVDILGRLLAEFYRGAVSVQISASDYRVRYQEYVERWITDLKCPLYEIPDSRLSRLEASLQHFLLLRGLYGLEPRAARVVEAHGDLRPEHIFFTHPPAIIDCLEFNRELRSLDPIEELCFLAVECERLQVAHVGERLLQLYSFLNQDFVSDTLVFFYKAYRCLLRAKLAAWHLEDAQVRHPEQWLSRASNYLDQAWHYANRLAL